MNTTHPCDFDECPNAPTCARGALQFCVQHAAEHDAHVQAPFDGVTYAWRVREADRAAEPYPAEAQRAGTVEQAVAVATAHCVDIDLFDVAGFRRGWVHADGHWSLT
jgi:hypothetical protein